MNTPYQRPAPADSRRRSTKVALVLLGTVGVVGGVVAWDAWKRADENDVATMPLEAPRPVAADRDYSNNDFTPGVGYYHAPYHAWYPYPYNYYDPARGYFAGGLWQAAPFLVGMMNSRPSADAVLAAQQAQQARFAQQAQAAQQNAQARAATSGSFFTRRTSAPSTPSYSSRPATPPSTSKPAAAPSSAPKPTIQRGGFGSSGHSSGGSSGS